MITRLRTWCRRVSPPFIYIISTIVLWGIFAFFPPFIASLGFQWDLRIGDLRQFSFGSIPVIISAALYAIFRVAAFHPFFRPRYRQWLELSPWQANLPLPLGPVDLLLQDLGIILLMTLLASIDPHAKLHYVAATFMTSYLAMLTASLVGTGQVRTAYLLACGLAGASLLWESPLVLAGLFCVLYFIAIKGMRSSLKNFGLWGEATICGIPVKEFLPDPKTRQFGWPYNHLSPRRQTFTQNRTTALALAALVAWWTLAAFLWLPLEERSKQAALVLVLVNVGMFLRCGAYISGHLPPISLKGRLRTFRWIIPGYDQIFIAPLLMLLVNLAALTCFYYDTLPISLLLPVTVFVNVLLAIGCPPTLETWRLTGEHRITHGQLVQTSDLVRTQ